MTTDTSPQFTAAELTLLQEAVCADAFNPSAVRNPNAQPQVSPAMIATRNAAVRAMDRESVRVVLRDYKTKVVQAMSDNIARAQVSLGKQQAMLTTLQAVEILPTPTE